MRGGDVPVPVRERVVQVEIERTAVRSIVGVAANKSRRTADP